MFLRIIILLLLFSASASLGRITDSLDVTLANEDSQPGSLVDVPLDDEHSHHSSSLVEILDHVENPFDETLAGEDGQIEGLTRMSNEKEVDVASLAIEEREEKMKSEEKRLVVWRLINIAAGSFLVIVFINLTAMLTILLGWNLVA